VCADATLREIAVVRPRSRDALLAVHGIGPVKVERFGDDILAIVAATPAPAPAAGRPA